jgi:hypothetical protein
MKSAAMPAPFCPRLSEASRLLPLLRAHIAAAAARQPLRGVISLDVLPIVDDGLFGYELLPDREMRVFLTIGRGERGVPTVRVKAYGPDAPTGLRLAAVDGRATGRSFSGVRHVKQHESTAPDWPAAVASAWVQLATQLPDGPRQYVEFDQTAHRFLDQALSIAHSHLAAWDPFIRFFGLPDEAQRGFELHGARGEHGELVAQRPDLWILRWKAPPHAVYEEWSVVLPEGDAATGLTCA